MPCPTCGDTLDCCDDSSDIGPDIYHCPRCGTLVYVRRDDGSHEVYVPKLVERCRVLLPKLPPMLRQLCYTVGITEAIYQPEDRPA